MKKFRITMATCLAALCVGVAGHAVVAPNSADAAIKTHPTGDTSLDQWCNEIGGMVDKALENEKAARDAGNTQSADAWREYANRLLAAGRSRGCDWYSARRIRAGLGNLPKVTSAQTAAQPSRAQVDTSTLTAVRVGFQAQP